MKEQLYNGYMINDIRVPSHLKDNANGALLDKATIWQQGSVGYVRINFNTRINDAWSYTGSMNNMIAKSDPTMDFGFLDPPLGSFTYKGNTYSNFNNLNHRNGCYSDGTCPADWLPGAVILHEFMHVLGGVHEHQNNQNSPLHFNTEAIYDYYCGGPGIRNSSCEEDANVQVLSGYTCYNPGTGKQNTLCYSYSDFDKDSILLYYMDNSWIAPGYSNPTKFNYRLSATDKAWLKDMYPMNGTKPTIHVTFMNGEDWQKALVQMIIEQNMVPYVGVNFIFDNPVGTGNGTGLDTDTNSGTNKAGAIIINGVDATIPIAVGISIFVLIIIVLIFMRMRRNRTN
jgi:hypothetical protein